MHIEALILAVQFCERYLRLKGDLNHSFDSRTMSHKFKVMLC